MRCHVRHASVLFAAALVHRRIPAAPLLCADVEPPPRDLDVVCEQARQSLRSALLQGKRGLTVDTSMASLDVTSRAYEPPVLARFAMEVSRTLTPVVEGEILLLLPGTSIAMEARELLNKEIGWPAEDRDRLSVSSLAMAGPPAERMAADRPGAVVLVGLTPSSDSDDPSYRHAREWMRSGAVVVSINAKLQTLPTEMADFETAYCLMTYTVARTDTWKGADANKFQEDAGSAVLWRRFPGDYMIMVDHGNAGDWTKVEQLRVRPDEEQLSSLLLPSVQQRQAALDSIRGSSVGGNAPLRSGAPAERPAAGGDGGTAGEGEKLDSQGVVTLDWADIEAGGSFGPTALYGALALHRLRVLGRCVHSRHLPPSPAISRHIPPSRTSDDLRPLCTTFAHPLDAHLPSPLRRSDACADPDMDARGLHIILTEKAEDAAAAWSAKFGKLAGGLRAACQLVPDGPADGIASLEQLAVAPGADAEAAATAVIARATAEARAVGQRAIFVLAPILSEGSPTEAALLAAGFERDGLPSGADDQVVAALLDAPDAMCLLLSGAEMPAPPTASEIDDVEPVVDVIGDLLEGVVEAREGPDEGGSAEPAPLADEGEADQLASEEDIERLRRMFGGNLDGGGSDPVA